MPIIKSAIKRAKQAEVNRARNARFKRQLRAEVKSLEQLLASKDVKKAGEQLNTVYGVLDTAAKKNLIHKNKAARRKAALAKAVAGIGGVSTASSKTKTPTPAKKAAAQPAAKAKTAAKPTAKKSAAKKPAAKKA